MDNNDTNDDELVGCRKPPADSRFRPGHSGNPAGRPKGSLNVATVLMRTLREKVRINENGRRKTITKLEASIKQLVNKAASGDLRALAQFLAVTISAEQSHNDASDESLSQLDQEVVADFLQRYGQSINPEDDHESNSD